MTRSLTTARLLGCACALWAIGCGDNTPTPPPPQTRTLAFRFDNLPDKVAPGDNVNFTLTLVDDVGTPFTGYKGTVKFDSNDATATLPPAFTFDGKASAMFNARFGLPGKWAIRVADTKGAPTGAGFLVVQGPATRLVKVSGDGQTGAASAKLGKQLVVQAIDDGGNPVGGVNVVWSVVAGGGSVTPANAATDKNGQSAADASLGPSGTAYTYQASVDGLVGSPVVFTSKHGPFKLVYTAPAGGKLRLQANPASTATAVVLDFVVGPDAVTGYSAGFNLPIDNTKVALDSMTPGKALDPGTSPVAAKAILPTSGPLKGVLVAAQSQKASGMGAVSADTTLAAGAVVYSVKLTLLDGAAPGVVFDGGAAAFKLKSAGLRSKTGNSVVGPSDVGIGKLEVVQ